MYRIAEVGCFDSDATIVLIEFDNSFVRSLNYCDKYA